MRVLIFILCFFVMLHGADAQDVSNEIVADAATSSIDTPGGAKPVCDPLTSRVLYEVKKGDNLVKILKTFKLAPLWCKGCSIQNTASINKLSNQNLIFINQKLELPFRCEADLASFEIVPRETERFVLKPGEEAPVRATASAAPTTVEKTVSVTKQSDSVVVSETLIPIDAKPAPVADQAPSVPVAAAAPAAPLATPVPAPMANDNRTSDLRFAGIYGFHSIYATEVNDGSHASLVSTPAYGFEVDWSIPWSDEWRSNVSLAQRFIQFRKATVGTIQDSGNNVGGFSVGLERRWSGTHVHLDVGAEQALGVRATGNQAIVLDPITVPFAEVSIEQLIHKSGPFEFAASVEYRFLGSTKTDSYDVKSGHAYGGGLSISQQLEKMKVDVRVDLRDEFQNSTIVEHDVKHLEMQIGITIPLGGASSSLKAPPR